MGPAYFRLLENRFFRDRDLRGKFRKPASLDLVMCTTRATKQYAERNLEYLGINDFVVLGRELKTWKHIHKLELIVDHIRSHPEPGLLLHLDAPDVLVTGDLQAVVDCFHSDFECDLLFGAEKNSAPGAKSTRGISGPDAGFISRLEAFEEASYQPPFQYLNAGCFIGRKECILAFFSEALESRKHWQLSSRLHHGDYMYNDDQLVLRELHRKHHPRIQIDCRNKVFQNLYAVKRAEVCAQPDMPGGVRLLAAYFSHLAFIISGKIRPRVFGKR